MARTRKAVVVGIPTSCTKLALTYARSAAERSIPTMSTRVINASRSRQGPIWTGLARSRRPHQLSTEPLQRFRSSADDLRLDASVRGDLSLDLRVPVGSRRVPSSLGELAALLDEVVSREGAEHT